MTHKTLIKNGAILIVTMAMSTSCATTAELARIEERQNKTELQVQGFEQKYESILRENNLFKEKLSNQLPITSTESHGVLFEVMKVYREGSQTIVELALTNKSNEDIKLIINEYNVTATDELGSPAKVLGFRYKGESRLQNAFNQTLYSKAPYRVEIILDNISASAEGIGLIGMERISNTTRNSTFNIALRNIKF